MCTSTATETEAEVKADGKLELDQGKAEIELNRTSALIARNLQTKETSISLLTNAQIIAEHQQQHPQEQPQQQQSMTPLAKKVSWVFTTLIGFLEIES